MPRPPRKKKKNQITNAADFVETAWEFVIIAAASARTKWEVAKRIEKQARQKHKTATNQSDRDFWSNVATRWVDLRGRYLWETSIYADGRAGGYGYGIKRILETMWTDGLNRDIEELPDFDEYRTFRIFKPVSFDQNVPKKAIEDAQKAFVPFDMNVDLNETNWEAQWRKYFNAFTHDNWTMIGSVAWLDTQIDGAIAGGFPPGGDEQYFRDLWKMVSDGGRHFFYYSRGCMAQTDFETSLFTENIPVNRSRHQNDTFIRYGKYDENTIPMFDGIYAINPEDLPRSQRSKVARLPQDLRYQKKK